MESRLDLFQNYFPNFDFLPIVFSPKFPLSPLLSEILMRVHGENFWTCVAARTLIHVSHLVKKLSFFSLISPTSNFTFFLMIRHHFLGIFKTSKDFYQTGLTFCVSISAAHKELPKQIHLANARVRALTWKTHKKNKEN